MMIDEYIIIICDDDADYDSYHMINMMISICIRFATLLILTFFSNAFRLCKREINLK